MCVPGLALNLEVEVLFGADWREPIAEGNCVAARRGGEEAGSEAESRRTGRGGRCGGVTQQRMGKPKNQADRRTGKSDSDRVKVQ